MCKKIHRGGNAEQYHADKKYKEAVAVAVEACADDTKGEIYAGTFLEDKDASMEEVREAVTLLESANEWEKRTLGPDHPQTVNSQGILESAREKLAGDPTWW